MQRTPLANRWVDERWAAIAVEIDGATTPAVERIDDEGKGTRWRCRGHEVELHPVEAEGYYLNVSAPEPKVFVLWRMAEPSEQVEPRARPLIVTLSYSEAARFLDAGEQVDAVPIPETLHVELERFVAVHWKPEPRKKAKRNELYEGEAQRKREVEGGRSR